MLEAIRSASASWCALYSTTHDMGSIGIRFHSCAQDGTEVVRAPAVRLLRHMLVKNLCTRRVTMWTVDCRALMGGPRLPALDGRGEHANEDLQHRLALLGLRLLALPAGLIRGHIGADMQCFLRITQTASWPRHAANKFRGRSATVMYNAWIGHTVMSMSQAYEWDTQSIAAAPVSLDLRGRAERVSAGVLGRLEGPPLGVLTVWPSADVQVHVPCVATMRALATNLRITRSMGREGFCGVRIDDASGAASQLNSCNRVGSL